MPQRNPRGRKSLRSPRRRTGLVPRPAAGGRLILLIGGAASGKSEQALKLAGTGARGAFVATAEALDQEMADRIRRHRDTRPQTWRTAEVPVGLVEWFEKSCKEYQVVIVECLTLWLSNLLGRGTTDEEIFRMVSDLVGSMRKAAARVIVVTNEVGMSLVPMDAGARHFRDLAGRVNQQFAEAADEVHLVMSGVALRIK